MHEIICVIKTHSNTVAINSHGEIRYICTVLDIKFGEMLIGKLDYIIISLSTLYMPNLI